MVWVDIDVGDVIDDISTQDLKDELESRSSNGDEGNPLPSDFDPVTGKNSHELLDAVYEARRNSNDARALELVDRLIYAAIGRIV